MLRDFTNNKKAELIAQIKEKQVDMIWERFPNISVALPSSITEPWKKSGEFTWKLIEKNIKTEADIEEIWAEVQRLDTDFGKRFMALQEIANNRKIEHIKNTISGNMGYGLNQEKTLFANSINRINEDIEKSKVEFEYGKLIYTNKNGNLDYNYDAIRQIVIDTIQDKSDTAKFAAVQKIISGFIDKNGIITDKNKHDYFMLNYMGAEEFAIYDNARTAMEEAMKKNQMASAIWGLGLIHNQNDFTNDMGTYGAKGSIAGNACGAIAVHNVNQILGRNIPFSQTYMLFNMMLPYAKINDGEMGTNPAMIWAYFKALGYDIQTYANIGGNWADFSMISTDYDAYISLYLYNNSNGAGAHYAALNYDANKGKYIAYNDGAKIVTDINNKPILDANGGLIYDYTPKEYRDFKYMFWDDNAINMIIIGISKR